MILPCIIGIYSITEVSFPLEPELCLLGKFTDLNHSKNTIVKFTEIALAVARRCVALKWKSDCLSPCQNGSQ